jgi:hypothetical protein
MSHPIATASSARSKSSVALARAPSNTIVSGGSHSTIDPAATRMAMCWREGRRRAAVELGGTGHRQHCVRPRPDFDVDV